MKKFFKITGVALLSLIGLLLAIFLLARFVFHEQAVGYLAGLEKQQRVELLRAADPYAADTVQYHFTYKQDSVRAREIREYFRLDTLVNPAAPTWDNARALAQFVARNIPHANQKVHPETRNAIGLWEYTRTVEPAFNCRMHSILLHELLLSQGIVNRFVTCLPADSLDQDCHVVNLVWLPEHEKWAMIDSDMQAWIESPAADPLSLAEMRERYIAGEPTTPRQLLGLDKDFTYYNAYWAKNLYWFICWEQTGYDKEIGYEGRAIALLPPGFEGFSLDESTVRTSDADRFWAAPQPEE
ncbi:transglutaminase domain-containing protein [Alistipes sp.]|uniref:transglutaminase domain-containing protein n=1 Tax=Alistipes sp. TaxID=1872444 RepID=UPI0025BF9988|nr:transglutaminase domain-containing protein [Alistipes sp.]